MNLSLPPVVSARELARLRRVLLLNLMQCAGAVIVLSVVYGWIERDRWFVVIIGLIIAMTGATVAALRQAQRGNGASAVLILSIATGMLALLVTAITPVALLATPIVLVPPVVLAASFVAPRVLWWMLAAMTVQAATLVLVGRLQHGAGLEERAPIWLIDLLMMVFIPLTVTSVSLSAWLNHQGLWARADELRQSRERLAGALDGERRRAERDLHDGAQQLLTAAALQLRVARRRLVSAANPWSEAELAAAAEALAQSVAATRVVAHGVYPAVLTDAGLGAALHTVDVPGVSVSVLDEGSARQAPDVEAAIYFCSLRLASFLLCGSLAVRLRDGQQGSLEAVWAGVGDAPGPVIVAELEDRIGALGGAVTYVTPLADGWEIVARVGGDVAAAAPVLTLRPLSVNLAVQGWAGSVVQALVLYAAGVRTRWMLVIAAAAIAGLAITWQARLALDAGSQRRAAVLMLVPFVVSAVLMTALAPQTLHYTPLMMLLGVLFVVPTARPAEATRLIVGASAVSVGLVALGRFQTWTGLGEYIGTGLFTMVLLCTIPALFVLTSLAVWSNHHELWMRATGLRRSSARLAVASAEARRSLAVDLERNALQLLHEASTSLREVRNRGTGAPRADEAVTECCRLLDEADDELQRLGAGLFPLRLADGDLAAALDPLADRSLGRVTVTVTAVQGLPVELATCLYFCCLEAVANALKHAGDRAKVRVRITGEQTRVVLEVIDDGSGFDRGRLAVGSHGGQGLVNLADRLSAIGGTLEVRSEPGTGTFLTATVPR